MKCYRLLQEQRLQAVSVEGPTLGSTGQGLVVGTKLGTFGSEYAIGCATSFLYIYLSGPSAMREAVFDVSHDPPMSARNGSFKYFSRSELGIKTSRRPSA